MSKFIREYIEKQTLTNTDEKGIKYWVTEDVGELVRCKDCEFLQLEDGGMYATCGKAILGIVRPNDYCSRAERKDNNV